MSVSPNNRERGFNFLDLPSEIRIRIYEDAGLVVGANLKLTPKRCDHLFSDLQPSSASLRFTYNVLQTCKAVNAEVKTHICSRNNLIVIHEHVYYGLELLRRLSPQQCSALINLFIQLHLEKPVLNDLDLHRSLPLSSPKSLHPALVTSWQLTARHILSHTTPRSLSLRLFCDTGISDATYAVLQPLEEFPGVLKDCELQLHHHSGNDQARALARETCIRAKGFDPDLRNQPFRFFDLPVEIRRHILEYSDLVTPYKEVYWCAVQAFHIVRPLLRCGGEDCDVHLHRGCRFLFCAPRYSMTPGYICCRHRSGYSSRCRCWEPPKALFLTNRSLYREALQVLYSCNRIIVVPSEGFRHCLDLDHTATRLDASRFITRHMWPDVLHNLRNLEFVLPTVTPTLNTVPHEPFYLDLCFALDHLKAHADIPKLTVVVNATSHISVHNDRESTYRELIGQGKNKTPAFQTYVQLLDCMKALRGLRRFFAHVEWGVHWSFDHPRIGLSKHNDFDFKMNEMESRLEKMVMGDDYNSEAAGKMNEPPSIWLYRIWSLLQQIWWPDLPEHQPLTL